MDCVAALVELAPELKEMANEQGETPLQMYSGLRLGNEQVFESLGGGGRKGRTNRDRLYNSELME